jgi:shikimate kinase
MLGRSKNIVLIGYRGTGKSSVGQYIAEKLDKKYISTDEIIVDRVGPINEYVEKEGWDKFRDVEKRIIKNIDTDQAVIDCGGGVIETAENYKPLKRLGPIFWLKASIDTIINRIKDSTNRPALSDKDFLSEIPTIHEKRVPLYRQFADYEIQTDSLTIQEVGEKIINIYRKSA